MDLKNLVEGECGGSNALMKVTSHFNQDKPLLDTRQRALNQRPLEEQYVNEFLAREQAERLQHLKGQNRFNMNALLHGLPDHANEEAGVAFDPHIAKQANQWVQEFSVTNDPLKQFDTTFDGSVMQMNPVMVDAMPETKWAHDFLAETEKHLANQEHIKANVNAVPVQSWISEYESKEFVEEARHFADLMKDDAEINGTEFMRFIKKVGNVGAYPATTEQSEEWAQDFGTRSENVIKDDTEFWNSLAENFDDSQLDTVDNWIDDYNDIPNSSLDAPNYKFTEENHLKDMENPFEEGMRKLQEGDIPSAVLLFEAACQREPQNELAWQYLGTTQAENEHDTGAIQALRECVALDGDNLTATMALAVCYTNESMQMEALRCLKQWISKNEKYRHLCDENFSNNVIDVESFKQAFADVRDTYINAARLSPTSPDADVQCGLGVLFNVSGEYDKAADCFTAALQVRPRDALLWNRLGATLANGNKPEEAVSAYRQALEISPGFLRARFNLGISCIGLKAYQEAGEHFLTVLNHQNAGRGPKGKRSRTAMSNNVWHGLRLVMSLMGRQDLYEYIDKQDLSFLNKEFNL